MRAALVLAAALAAACLSTPVSAQKSYGPGVSDTEIKIGNTMPYSGPASPLGITGRVISAYFDEVNEKGGDQRPQAQSVVAPTTPSRRRRPWKPPRRLVEGDGVAFIFATMGHGAELGDRKIPQQQQGAAAVPDQLGLEVERSRQHAVVDGAAMGAELH